MTFVSCLLAHYIAFACDLALLASPCVHRKSRNRRLLIVIEALFANKGQRQSLALSFELSLLSRPRSSGD